MSSEGRGLDVMFHYIHHGYGDGMNGFRSHHAKQHRRQHQSAYGLNTSFANRITIVVLLVG